MRKIDICIPLGSGTVWEEHNELRYTLRSIEANFPQLGNIYIVGVKPSWLNDEIIHIPADDIFASNKDGNLIRKTLIACTHDIALSDSFVRMSDDQLFLKSISEEDLIPCTTGDIFELGNLDRSRWRRRLKRTAEVLKSRNYPTLNYDVHMPMLVDKKDFIEIMNSYNYQEDTGYCINSLFFNSLENKANSKKNYISNIKCTFERSFLVSEIYKEIDGKLFMGYNDAGLNDNLKNIIKNLFPNKSKYER